jgi:(p)ppGpp synthase/HD superfamily hydrolase
MLEQEEPSYNKTTLTLEELESRLSERGDLLGLSRVVDAYLMAKSVHEHQQRNDGTPYFFHCARTARIILDELGIYDTDLLIGSLLHDVLEDSETITRGILEYNFGSYVAYLVETLTKDLDRARLDPDAVDLEHVESLKRASDDCMIIKLAGRLDNVRCLAFNLKRNPLVYLTNTLERYVPIAEHSTNAHLKKLAGLIRLESNKYLG